MLLIDAYLEELLKGLVLDLRSRGAVFRPGVVIQGKHTTAGLFTD